jgi:hypothetical protein
MPWPIISAKFRTPTKFSSKNCVRVDSWEPIIMEQNLLNEGTTDGLLIKELQQF